MKQIIKPLATRKNYCSLDLCLLTPSQDHNDDATHNFTKGEGSGNSQLQQQQMTIFYNGNICVCDVTELQARLILHHARKETDDPLGSPYNCTESASPSLVSPLYSPTGMSLKRSLQRFLQKRRHRIHASSPYHQR